MLQIRNIRKEYHTGDLTQRALDDVSLDLRDSEFVAILGPSGSGKTTLLNIIGGLDRYDSGDLIINGVSTKKYKDRDWDSYRNHTIGFVFQSYNLIPHQTVLANVELALTISGVRSEERRKRAEDALAKVGLLEHAHKRPSQLSGGQMQRVAIARALVNDPDILLADEPTGALDSETSIQVMDLLKEVARDRLVVMVTHNPDLARQYATRIVTLKDGKITGDTNPYLVTAGALKPPVHKNLGRAAMNFATALKLSFQNLRTKKARTILVAFAGSIGIIGIALILALSSGVNRYVHDTEQKTLSQYPVEITSSSFDLGAFMASGSDSGRKKASEGQIREVQTVQDMLSTMNSNDLKSLKDYFDGGKSGIEKYSRTVEYSYDLTPNIYRMEGKTARQVNPNESFKAAGIDPASMLFSGSSTMKINVFSKLPQTPALYSDQYDVKAGRWPKSSGECVVVTMDRGGVSDFLLYTLGLRDSDKLDAYVKKFAEGRKVEVKEKPQAWKYSDILGVTFRAVPGCRNYSFNESKGVWTDRSDDQKFMNRIASHGRILTVVGVVSPKSGSDIQMLSSGIWYTDGLVQDLRKDAAGSKIVKEQLAHPHRNVLTGKKFGAKNAGNIDMNSLFTVDENALKKAFTVDAGKLKTSAPASMPDMKDIDFQKILAKNLPKIDAADLAKQVQGIDTGMTQQDLQQVIQAAAAGYAEYQKTHPLTDMNQLSESVSAYLSSPEGQKVIFSALSQAVDQKKLEEALNKITAGYQKQISAAMEKSFAQIGQQMASGMTASMNASMNELANAFRVDPKALAKAFRVNMDEDEMKSFLTTMMTSGTDTLDSNLSAFGYAGDDDLSAITIYPKDFEAKDHVTKILTKYNQKVRAAGEKEKVITYTDIVGTLMSSVTKIVNAISYVLIAFVSISLVVSSIMIGVITYISVLERRKEIGILRAMGASKRNVGQVFNAETFITGLLAGLIGIVLSLLLIIPMNMVIAHVTDVGVRAYLPPAAAVVLVLLSVVLTLLGGLIPARRASKSDPVTALRTE